MQEKTGRLNYENTFPGFCAFRINLSYFCGIFGLTYKKSPEKQELWQKI